MPIYVIRAGDTPYVKIGWAVKPTARLADLQTAHYETLQIIRTMEGSRTTEIRLHQYFSAHAIRGEWFRFTEEMLTVNPDDLPLPPTASVVDPLLPEIESFVTRAGITVTAFGKAVANDPGLVHKMRRGRECRRRISLRIREYIAEHAAP